MRALFWLNVVALCLLWLCVGDDVYDQTYGWWKGKDSGGYGLAHSPLILFVLAIPLFALAVLITNLAAFLTHPGKPHKKAFYRAGSLLLLIGLVGFVGPTDSLKLLTVRLLGPGSRGDVLLINSAGAGRTSVVEALLDVGVDPDSHVPGGDTALHRAARGGHVDVIRLLIDRGANVNIRGSNNLMPLHQAEMSSNHEAIALLMAHGAKKW